MLKAFVSSTILDLPEHRERAMDACLRQGILPLMMEHLGASADTAITVSLRMIDEADIYIGVYGFRYGYVPQGYQESVTHLEYLRALARNMPRIVLIMDAHHPLHAGDVETGAGATKLEEFKAKVQTENIASFFRSPDELRACIIDSLSKLKTQTGANHSPALLRSIPEPPNPYIPHPYALLQTHRLIGRRAELRTLTNWIAGDHPSSGATVFSLIGLGGTGKSSLAWEWFQREMPKAYPECRASIWWSFYESEPRIGNFAEQTLAYLTNTRQEDVRRRSLDEQLDHIALILDQTPVLIVLDGFERIQNAYTGFSASLLGDFRVSRIEDKGGAIPRRLRFCSSDRASRFLKKLAIVKRSKILLTSRLIPAELETVTERPVPGSFHFQLGGLTVDDALQLWREIGISGSDEEIADLARSIDCHPLLLQALAREIARDRRSPGDFGRWRESNPGFNPFALPLAQRRSHILHYSMSGLSREQEQVLRTIAHFRMPVGYQVLLELLVGNDLTYTSERELVDCLTELEDRALVGWDRSRNTYDEHPLVRGMVWTSLGDADHSVYYDAIARLFAAAPAPTLSPTPTFEELSPAIELFNALVRRRMYNEAYSVYKQRLRGALIKLVAAEQSIQLLREFLPRGLDSGLDTLEPYYRPAILRQLASAHIVSGQPRRAVPLLEKATSAARALRDLGPLLTGLGHLGIGYLTIGSLYAADECYRRMEMALSTEKARSYREFHNKSVAETPLWHGLVFAVRGLVEHANESLERSTALATIHDADEYKLVAICLRARLAIWRENPEQGLTLSQQACSIAAAMGRKRDYIHALVCQSSALQALGQISEAENHAVEALEVSRELRYGSGEVRALVAMAELIWRRREIASAKNWTMQALDLAQSGGYRLELVDAYNILAEIENFSRDVNAAAISSTKAYELAWCDGPPFFYRWGLARSKQHLLELNIPVPELPINREVRHLDTLDLNGLLLS